ncbi:MAG: M20 family peptidase [Tepidanaerobacteraceae bacterium]|nr:M20 family peptidase [Tepidanaerobacteraceae bacterium]
MKIGFIVILAALVGVVLLKTISFKSRKYIVSSKQALEVDVQRIARHLSDAVKFKTVSYSDSSIINWDEFLKLHKYLEETYPLVHSKLEMERVNDHSLLYRWPGSEKNKKPILLTCHMDVVPVEDETKWTYPPFNGDVAEGFVWGRGTLDVKVQMIAILEVVEQLLKKNYKPNRDIYLAFGHDEEVGGKNGAIKIAELLKSRGINFEFVHDEGGCVTDGTIKGVLSPIAVVGICEKGYADIKLSVEDKGGHSSMPPKSTALGRISKAIYRLEQNPFPMRITKPVSDMLNYIGPEMKGIQRIIIANLWLFSPIFKKVFSSSATGNAFLRTTMAATMAKGSDAHNVLPQKATAVVNTRILPGETVKDVVNHIRRTINDQEIKIDLLNNNEPSKISDITSEAFKNIERTIYEIFPDTITCPYLVCGGTDARKYEGISDNVYRFSPFHISAKDLNKMHGTDECISLANLEKAVKFFLSLILKQ